VRVVEQRAGLDALLSVSTDGSTFVFDRHHGAVPALVKGDVLLIKGLLARKVIAAEHTADEIALLTVPAGLLDIVSDAKIRLHAPIRFGSPASAATATPDRSAWQFAADAILAPAHAQSPVEERRKAAEKQGRNDAYGNIVKAPYKALMDGWNTEFSAEPAPGRLNLTLKLKKSNAGVAAIVSGEGYLADFDLDADIDVQRSTVEKMQVAYRKLNGVMNFKWDIQTTNDGSLRGNAFMKLPAAVEIPLYQYLGGLPLFLEVSSAVIIKPGIGSEYSFSHGEFRITYDGYQSFGAKQGVVDSDGKVTGDIKLVDSTSGSGPPVGLVVAFAAPRVELSIGVSKVFKFDGVKDAAAKADKYFDILVTKAFGTEALNKFKASPMSKVTATQIADAAMGSDAAAFIQLVTTSGMSHTGTAVMVPCTRTDLHMSVKVGTSAKAFGQSVGDAEKEIFKKDVTRVRPSENALCNSV
ncbi:MAG: hypothetical protein LH470_00700, partial [Lysobacter sp.]|nr:hypothetical protein [Lysobacter sp.]